jgi:actin-related protein
LQYTPMMIPFKLGVAKFRKAHSTRLNFVMYSQYKGSVVFIDNGSSCCKVGFAGDPDPRSVFPSVIGCARKEALGEIGSRTRFTGRDALENRGKLILKYPIECGSVINWEEMEQVPYLPSLD